MTFIVTKKRALQETIIDNNRILIIDDDRNIWQTFHDILEPGKEDPVSQVSDLPAVLTDDEAAAGDTSFCLSYADQGETGYKIIRQALADKTPYAVAFIDIRMPSGLNGMETAVRIRQIDSDLEIVIVTAFSDLSRKSFMFIKRPTVSIWPSPSLSMVGAVILIPRWWMPLWPARMLSWPSLKSLQMVKLSNIERRMGKAKFFP